MPIAIIVVLALAATLATPCLLLTDHPFYALIVSVLSFALTQGMRGRVYTDNIVTWSWIFYGLYNLYLYFFA